MTRLDDGFSTTVTFSAGSSGVTFLFYEKESTPPGISGGGLIDTTTMRNTTWRTGKPKSLKTLLDSSFVGAYDPEVLDEINIMINVNQLITVTFPDGSNWQFWGKLDEFIPNAHVEGEQPTANILINPTNQNNSNVEVAPVYNDAA
jgi:hypothetical protein